jgi:hypothetical protein
MTVVAEAGLADASADALAAGLAAGLAEAAADGLAAGEGEAAGVGVEAPEQAATTAVTPRATSTRRMLGRMVLLRWLGSVPGGTSGGASPVSPSFRFRT